MVQIGFMPPSDQLTPANVGPLINYGLAKGLDFMVAPITTPHYERVLFRGHSLSSTELRKWRAGQEAMTPEDLVLQVAERSDYLVGLPAQWMKFDSPDATVRLHSELALKQQLNWTAHLGLGGVMLPYPPSFGPLSNYSRVLASVLQSLTWTTCWIRIPLMDLELEMNVSNPSVQGTKSWERWNMLRTMVDADPKLGIALELSETVPSDEIMDRWFAEPVKALIIPEEIFLTNNSGFPVLSKRHQAIVRGFIKAPGLDEQFAAGYQDYLQAPLQPLQDNLESSTYETFEKDPIKYQQYELAVEKALRDRPQPSNPQDPDTAVLMVVGAGRGPLVNCSLRAAEKAKRNVRIYAVEKNPNAFVTYVFTAKDNDMRTWNAPEKADILVSELLGSFGDNELSPECLDGAQKFLKPGTGISIPASYTAFVAPLSSSKLHNNVSAFKDSTRFESSYVVKFQAISLLAEPKPVWTFDHPNVDDIPCGQESLSNHHNIRSASILFELKTNGIIHGIAGYFESVLYKDVTLSINPQTHSPGMFSWFPIYFPVKTPIYAPAGSVILVEYGMNGESDVNMKA
ncbi:hypothetical protein DFQ27_007291 [Actinomortierella ambigua]|uniref:Protein arginine N-methyltransferase n=1 Tax=Actinomortierella ambigua TaxID=1343610 RepID=A0A9P6PTB5_9FUNG|nr:hypothetical protein DFQ27_007291 [Actinomortierella ambigua]